MMFRRLGVVVFCAVQAALTSGSVFAQTQSFDPAICPPGNGEKLAIRLESGLGLLVEPSGFLPTFVYPPPDDPALPPYGCVENPVVLRGITFLYDYEAALQRLPRPDMGVNRPALLRVTGFDGPVRLQRSALVSFERYKEDYDSCEITSENLEICLNNCSSDDPYCADPIQNDRVVHPELFNWAGRALPGTYVENDGLPYVIQCRHSFTRWWCEVRYEIEEGLLVSYRILQEDLPVNGLIAFDREIRRQIEDARAPQLDSDPIERDR